MRCTIQAIPNHIPVRKPLFFDYSGMAKHPAPMVCLIEAGPASVRGHSASTRTTEQFHVPWASADLFAKHTQWHPAYPGVIPQPVSKDHFLKSGKAYYVEVALDIPESDINRLAGIFGVSVELQSSNGCRLASSMRTTKLPHETFWISSVRKFLWLGPLLLGAVHETKRLVVPSYRYFVESSDQPLVSSSVLGKGFDVSFVDSFIHSFHLFVVSVR